MFIHDALDCFKIWFEINFQDLIVLEFRPWLIQIKKKR